MSGVGCLTVLMFATMLTYYHIKIVNNLLSINFIVCFGCSKELSH